MWYNIQYTVQHLNYFNKRQKKTLPYQFSPELSLYLEECLAEITFQPAHIKTYNKTGMTSKDLDQHVHPGVLIPLDSPEAVEGTCDQWRLIRLHECAGWSESLLVAQVLLMYGYLRSISESLGLWGNELTVILRKYKLDMKHELFAPICYSFGLNF